MNKASWLVKTLILVAIVLGLTLIRAREVALWGSFVLIFATVVFLPWALYSLVRIAIKPAERRNRAIRLAIWAAALAVVFATRAHWDAAARKEANAAIAAIQAHKGRTGGYPQGLGELGLDAGKLREEWSLSYRVSDGQAALFYSQPSMPTIAHHYNFEAKSWARQD